jgi:hypothetical protein
MTDLADDLARITEPNKSSEALAHRIEVVEHRTSNRGEWKIPFKRNWYQQLQHPGQGMRRA